MFSRELPYNDLPLLPPETDLENQKILKETIVANKALAELKGIANTLQNQAMLVNTLPLQEARASSEIENIITTSDTLYEAFSAQTGNYDQQTKEVLRYREALWEGYNSLKKNNLLTINLIIKIFQKIKNTNEEVRNTPGTIIRNSRGETIYTPPDVEGIIRNKLGNLEKYIHNQEDKTDPLIKLAVNHYQFEAIHPFTDGNGRTGRIMNILYLVHQGLIDLPVIYLSRYIIENKSEYYAQLRNVTENNEWLLWILYMLKGISVTAVETIERIGRVKNLFDNTVDDLKRKLPARVYSKELVELLFMQPYCKVEFIVKAGLAKRQTAAEYLKEIEKTGFLTSKKIGKEMLYLNKSLFEILSD
jgi:Fic family protein